MLILDHPKVIFPSFHVFSKQLDSKSSICSSSSLSSALAFSEFSSIAWYKLRLLSLGNLMLFRLTKQKNQLQLQIQINKFSPLKPSKTSANLLLQVLFFLSQNYLSRMKISKSEPKIKFSINKYSNFFTEKDFKGEMYMDDDDAGKLNIEDERKNQSNAFIKPRAKLTYSLNERIDTVFTDKKKIGMIEKEQSTTTRQSIGKISKTSMLPPIRTEQKETLDHLVKLKNEVNEINSKNIKIENQISKLEGSTRQVKEKIIFYNEYLHPDTAKTDQAINSENVKIQWTQYQNEVLQNMRNNLKEVNIGQNRKKVKKQAQLKEALLRLNSITDNLEQAEAKLINSQEIKEKFLKKQKENQSQFLMRSTLATSKITEEHKAHYLSMKLANEEEFHEHNYIEETNLKNHNELLSQYRVQYMFSQILESLKLKYRLECQEQEKCEKLLKMYSMRNYSKAEREENSKLQMSLKSMKSLKSLKSLKSSTHTLTNSTSKSTKVEDDFDLVAAFNSSFEVKKDIEMTIKQHEERIKQIQKKHEKLFKKWVEATYNDNVTGGQKVKKKKVNFDKEIKQLYRRQKQAETNINRMQKIKYWIKKQQDKLGLKISKKSTVSDYIKSIMSYVINEEKKISKK